MPSFLSDMAMVDYLRGVDGMKTNESKMKLLARILHEFMTKTETLLEKLDSDLNGNNDM